MAEKQKGRDSASDIPDQKATLSSPVSVRPSGRNMGEDPGAAVLRVI